jgi:hypothetical protein
VYSTKARRVHSMLKEGQSRSETCQHIFASSWVCWVRPGLPACDAPRNSDHSRKLRTHCMEGQHCLVIEWINPSWRPPPLRDVWSGPCVSQDLASGDVGPAGAQADVLQRTISRHLFAPTLWCRLGLTTKRASRAALLIRDYARGQRRLWGWLAALHFRLRRSEVRENRLCVGASFLSWH